MMRRGVGLGEWMVMGALVAVVLVFATRNLGYHTSCMYQSIGIQVANNSGSYSNGCMDTSQDEIRWTVYAGPGNVQTLGMATAGQSYGQSISPAYSVQGYAITYTVTSGSLPTGLTLNPNTGVISGMPSASPTTPAYTQTVQIMASDKTGSTRQALYVTVPARGKYVFSYTGGEQYFHVFNGMEQVLFKAWGAGGGSAGVIDGGTGKQGWGGWDNGDYGGGGGYATGSTVPSGNGTYTIIVGQGGQIIAGTHAFGGGGASIAPTTVQYGTNPYTNQQINAHHWSGGGGGESAVSLNGQQLIVAGGGGGAGALDPYAGAGGGYTGQDATALTTGKTTTTTDNGRGGTQAAGGVPVNTTYMYAAGMNGSKDQGGDATVYDDGGAGGGGGGYYGGSSGNDSGGGGGGGGSSYVAPLTNGSTMAGNNQQAANQGDSDILPGIGQGQANNTPGNNGEVVIYWGKWS